MWPKPGEPVSPALSAGMKLRVPKLGVGKLSPSSTSHHCANVNFQMQMKFKSKKGQHLGESPFPDEQLGEGRATFKEGRSDFRGNFALGSRSSRGVGAVDRPRSPLGEGKKGNAEIWVSSASNFGRHIQNVFIPL